MSFCTCILHALTNVSPHDSSFVKKIDFKIHSATFGTVLANPAIPANLFFYSTDRILRK